VALRLAERAEELEREREAFATLSVRYERARIASELHDIVAHAISVMVVQAGAGQRVAAVDPELTGEMFEAIAGAARQAEQDMTQLVALLSDEDAIGHGTGNGLRGLRERVGAGGGRLEAGPRESGGWRVAARIPCAVAVTVDDAR
jgi:signal transduction histidine kinase